MRRALLSWTLVFALLLAGFGAAVLGLNADVFSAHGFVRSYLEALERHDTAEALGFDGVELPKDVAADLVADAALGDIDDIRLLSDVAHGNDHTVRFEYRLSGGTQVTEFHVERTGTRLGLFSAWRFTASPVGILDVGVDHDPRFTANGVDAAAGAHAVLVPGAYSLEHDSKYLESANVLALAIEPGATVDALVEVTPTAEFATAAAAAITVFLDACATQEVLMPTGCPFGDQVSNRLDSAPEWSMLEYPPTVKLGPGNAVGEWRTSTEPGVAHVTANVRSLFDGTVSTLDEDVPFSISYVITLGVDDSISVSVPRA
jgi:hypothetical protein